MDKNSDRNRPYHALQTSVTKNSARAGLGLQASYTYGKSLDDTSSVLGGLFGSSGTILQTAPQNPWNPSAEKGPSTFDVTHMFSASVIQLLPLDRLGFLKPLGNADRAGIPEYYDADDGITQRVFRNSANWCWCGRGGSAG
jgi:hypothetical protein